MIVRFKRKESVGLDYEEVDTRWLEKVDGKWPIRKSLVDDSYADLVRVFKNGKVRKKEKKNPEATCRKITEFFTSTDNAVSLPSPLLEVPPIGECVWSGVVG